MKQVTNEQIVQLREHDLNRGHNKSNTPVYPKTVIEAIEGLDKLSGVAQVSSLPAQGEVSKIYYNTTDSNYYTYNTTTQKWETLGSSKPAIVTSIDDVEHIYAVIRDQATQTDTLKVTASLAANTFYDITNWFGNDISDESITDYAIVFNFNPDTDDVYAGRFVATNDNMNLSFPAGVIIAEDDTDIQQYHQYEFNCYRGVVFIKDIRDLSPEGGV